MHRIHLIAEAEEMLDTHVALLVTDKGENTVGDLLAEDHHAAELFVVPDGLAAEQFALDYQGNYVP
jgi:hypothetical protein